MMHVWPLHDPCRGHPCMPQSRNTLHPHRLISLYVVCKWRALLARPRICREDGSSRAVFRCDPNTIHIHHVRYSPVQCLRSRARSEREGERERTRHAGPPTAAARTLIELSIKRAGGFYYCANAQCQHVYRQGLQVSQVTSWLTAL